MMSLEPDHYAVLELEPGSPMEDVKSQYRRLAKRCHPDLHGNGAEYQEQFRRVNAAYAFLADASRKAAYDACLQAARKMGAPPPRPSPTPKPSPAPPTATGYHTPGTATGYHERMPADVRMRRSAWLGATAGVVLVLLVIGLFWDGSDLGRPVTVGGASPAAIERAPLGALGDGSEPGDAAGPAASLPEPPPSVPFGVPAVGPSQARPPRPSPSVPYSPAPLRVGGLGRADVMPAFRAANLWPRPPADKANPADALKQRLLARYQAALPRTDRLIARGYASRAAGRDTEDGSRRILRDQLAADLADLSATRARIRPAIARLSRQDTAEELQEETGPILTDLRRLEELRQPVRDDLQALSAAAFASAPRVRSSRIRPSSASVVPAAPVPSAPVPAAFIPAAPAPRAAPAVPEAPKPLDKPAAKPKAPASSGQDFIMWGK